MERRQTAAARLAAGVRACALYGDIAALERPVKAGLLAALLLAGMGNHTPQVPVPSPTPCVYCQDDSSTTETGDAG